MTPEQQKKIEEAAEIFNRLTASLAYSKEVEDTMFAKGIEFGCNLLQERLDEAERVIEFYAKRQNWTQNDRGCTDDLPNDIIKNDFSKVKFTEADGDIFEDLSGGKKAREYLSKWGKNGA